MARLKIGDSPHQCEMVKIVKSVKCGWFPGVRHVPELTGVLLKLAEAERLKIAVLRERQT